MSKTPATKNSLEGIVTALTNTVSALLKSKGAIAVIIISILAAFLIGYLSGRPRVFNDSPNTAIQNAL